jgi:1-acyl-sn-glycerol-3-phosphate acyltransferase
MATMKKAGNRMRRSPAPKKTTARRPKSVPPPINEPVLEQIRELEAQLDELIDRASRRDLAEIAGPEEAEEAPVLEAEVEVPAPPISIPISRPSVREMDATVFDTARELLSTDFYLRKWGRVGMRRRSEEVDDFGFDPIYDQKLRPALEFLYSRYFRVSTKGIERVPARGRCLLVANHSGTLPLDGVMIKTAVKLEHPDPRDVRWLTEDFITHMPWLGSTMNRLGAVRAHQDNAERLLAKEQLVAVFPEGVKGIGKLFGERYRLQRFGRGGFIKLALRTGTPVVPVAVVGAEETNPLLFRFEYLAKTLGVPYVPVTPTFPLLGPLGLVPAPTKWQIHFGEPMDFGAHGKDAADDELLVAKLAERVRATIQEMLDEAVGSRKSVFFG